MGLFSRRKKETVERSTSHIEGYGDATIVVSRRPGEVPKVDVTIPAEYLLGLKFQQLSDELGQTHPETLKAAHRYFTALGNLPDRREESIRILDWLADNWDCEPEVHLQVLDDLSRVLLNDGQRERAARRRREAAELRRAS